MRASLFYIIVFGFLLVSCTDNSDELLGDWSVKDPFFTATYSIKEEEGEIVGLITHYNDGTTKFDKPSNKQYLFKGLYQEGDVEDLNQWAGNRDIVMKG